MPDPLVNTLLAHMLDAASAALTAQNIPVPVRAAVWQTKPVMDLSDQACSLLAVYCDKIEARGLGERRPSGSGELQSKGWHSVALVRIEYHDEYPNLNDVGSAPDSAEVTTATNRLAAAAWAIWCGLGAAIDAGTLFSSLDKMLITREDIGIGSMTPITPNGYAAGWQMNYEVALPAVYAPSS